MDLGEIHSRSIQDVAEMLRDPFEMRPRCARDTRPKLPPVLQVHVDGDAPRDLHFGREMSADGAAAIGVCATPADGDGGYVV